MSKRSHARRNLSVPADTLRLVVSPDNQLVIDIHHTLPVDTLGHIGAFPDVLHRGLKHDVHTIYGKHIGAIRSDIHQHIASQAYHAVCYTLSMAHKSGALWLGRDAVMQAITEDKVDCVIIADDAGKAESQHVIQAATPMLCHHFSQRHALGKLVGRASQVYIAIRPGALSQKCQRFLRLYTRFSCDVSL